MKNLESKVYRDTSPESATPLTSTAFVQYRDCPCGICGERSGTGTGFSASTSVFPCQCHSIKAPLHLLTYHWRYVIFANC